MNFELKTLPSFDKSVKQLIKKHPSFKADLISLKKLLLSDPKTGVSIGNSCYKVRLAISGKN